LAFSIILIATLTIRGIGYIERTRSRVKICSANFTFPNVPFPSVLMNRYKPTWFSEIEESAMGVGAEIGTFCGALEADLYCIAAG
jgi:hypothetical protein